MVRSPKKIENAQSCRSCEQDLLYIIRCVQCYFKNFALMQHKSIGPDILASLKLIGEVLLNRECGCQRVNNILNLDHSEYFRPINQMENFGLIIDHYVRSLLHDG